MRSAFVHNGTMRRTVGFALAWLGATAIAVIVAAAAVGSVRTQVTNEPTALGAPTPTTISADDSVAGEQTTTTESTTIDPPSVDPVSTTTTSAESVTTPPEEPIDPPTPTTTVTADPSTTTTSTTVAVTTTTEAPDVTTTTAAPASYTKTYDTDGGSVRVIVEGSSITFGGAVPKPGWSVELKDGGPDEVKVEFEENAGSGEVEFEAHVEDDGELVVEISQEGDE